MTASLEIEQARKRQLVETFLKHEMQLPTIEKSDDDEDGANATRGAEDALEASLRDDEKKRKKERRRRRKRRRHRAAQETTGDVAVGGEENLRLAKRTRRLCDAMVLLKDKGVGNWNRRGRCERDIGRSIPRRESAKARVLERVLSLSLCVCVCVYILV